MHWGRRRQAAGPVPPLRVNGALTESRELWREGLRDFGSERYGDEENVEDPHQRARQMFLDGEAFCEDEQARADLSWSEMLEALGRGGGGAAGGGDGTVLEMWRACPIEAKVRIMAQFKFYAGLTVATASGATATATSTSDPIPADDRRPSSWRVLLLEGLRKETIPENLGQFRYIGLTASLSMWYMRILVARMDEERSQLRQRRRAHTFGFSKGW